MSLATPEKIRILQRKLYRKAKAEPAFRDVSVVWDPPSDPSPSGCSLCGSGCRVGFAPTGKRRLFTAHAMKGLMHCSKVDEIQLRGLTTESLTFNWLNKPSRHRHQDK